MTRRSISFFVAAFLVLACSSLARAKEPFTSEMMSLEELFRALPGSSGGVELSALLDHVKSSPDESVDQLLLHVRSRFVEQRRAALMGLGEVKDPRAETLLLTALAQGSYESQCLAALSLGNYGSTKAVALLEKVIQGKLGLSSRTLRLRQNAAVALASIGDASVLPTLLIAVEKDRLNREALSVALAALGETLTGNDIHRMVESRTDALRRAGALILGSSQDSSSVISIIKLLGDKSYRVRQGAAVALGRLGNKAGEPALIRAQEDENAEVRKAAARSLEILKSIDHSVVSSVRASEGMDSWFSAVVMGLQTERVFPRRGRGAGNRGGGMGSPGPPSASAPGATTRMGGGAAGAGMSPTSNTSSGSGGQSSDGPSGGASSGSESSGTGGHGGSYRGPEASAPAEAPSSESPGSSGSGTAPINPDAGQASSPGGEEPGSGRPNAPQENQEEVGKSDRRKNAEKEVLTLQKKLRQLVRSLQLAH